MIKEKAESAPARHARIVPALFAVDIHGPLEPLMDEMRLIELLRRKRNDNPV